MASLFDKRVVITRPRHQATTMVEMIRERGGQPICIPVIEIAPLEDFTQLDQALRQVQSYDWLVLTSVNGVNAVWERFEALKQQREIIGDVRGKGPMLALELVRDRETKEPAAEEAKALVKFCYEKGLILLSCGNFGNVIRTLMPLVITDELLERGLAIMEDGFASISK